MSERMEIEKVMADLSGKNEALTMLLEKEKENTNYYLNELKERFQERRLELERRIIEEHDTWEAKLRDAEKWKKKLQEENDELRSIINLIKAQGVSGGKKSEQITEEISRGISKLDSNVARDISFIRETLSSFASEVQNMHQEKFDLRLKYEMEKDLADMEKYHAQQINDAKALSSSVMEKLRESYEDEIRDLREQIATLEKAKQLHLVKLVEKEGIVTNNSFNGSFLKIFVSNLDKGTARKSGIV